MHPFKSTVWYAVPLQRLTGSYFFEDNENDAVTITAEWYCQMVPHFLRAATADNLEIGSNDMGLYNTHCSGHNVTLG